MDELLQLVFGAIATLGAIATAMKHDPFDKLISLGLIAAGTVPFIVARGLLDVSVAVSIIGPLGTIFILLLCGGDGR
ncbi:MAG: EhaD family protein [Methanomicrobiales archaeon]|nr:EhaD family protein [Methanomicrobiales archaeon]